MRANAIPALLAVVALCAVAASAAAESLSCGTAQANIALYNKGRLGYTSATLDVRSGKRQVTRRFEFVWLNAACLTNPAGRPFLVYQAYCGGPRCSDEHDWGIIEPASLKVLLEPSAGNRKKAEAIFGGPLDPL
ncbi:MAG: putative secreted protein [Moraxellaceae bacterium]|jgi:hypothetical protein|nr:putative secreted protein [Moraxellaceae bacterium]